MEPADGAPALLNLAAAPAVAPASNGLLSVQTVKDKVRATASHVKKEVKATTKAMAKPDRSRFHSWSTAGLRELLVYNGIEVRGANRAPHEFIVGVCDQVFEGMEMPPPPPTRTFEEMALMNTAALRIQHLFTRIQAAKIEAAYRVANEERNRRLMSHGVQPSLTESDRGSVSGRRQSTADHQDAAEASMMSHCDNHKGVGNVTKLNRKQQEDELSVPWKQPSVRYAKRYYRHNHPHHAGDPTRPYDYKTTTLGRHCVIGGCGEQLDLWDEGQVSEFGQFGSGVTNYFKFLKWCCWVMFILAVVHTPSLVLNSLGAVSQYESVGLASTTVGNLGDSFNVTTIKIPFCNEDEFQQHDCTIDKSELAYFYALLDCMATGFVLVGWLWLRSFEKKESDNLDRATVTASDYTVRVPKIPADTTELELAGHFAHLTGCSVADVSIAYDNSEEIEMYFTRGKLMKERFLTVQKIRYVRSVAKRHGNHMLDEEEMSSLLKTKSDITSKIEELDTLRAIKTETFPAAIQAFVTFDTEQGFLKAIKAYQLSWVRKGPCFPRPLRFKGMRIKAVPAPEPSTILWENLGVGKWERLRRKVQTTMLALCLVAFSIVFTLKAREVQQSAMDEGGLNECPADWEDMTTQGKVQMITGVESSPVLHCYCEELSMVGQWNDPLCKAYVKMKTISTATAFGAAGSISFINWLFTFLMNKAAVYEKHQSMDSMEASILSRTFILQFLNSGCVMLCYNIDWLKAAVGSNLKADADFSQEWYQSGGTLLMFTMFCMMVSPHVAPYMRYRSSRAEMKKCLSPDFEDLLSGRTDEVPYYTQDDLNSIFLGPEFHMDLRYAQALVNFFICFIYMTGMPLILWIGFFCFYVSFWVDKWLFCTFYRIPPMYSDRMGRTATSLLGYSIFLHLMVSIWALGNRAIFESDDFAIISNSTVTGISTFDEYEANYNPFRQGSLRKNLEQKHVQPLCALLGGLLVAWFVNRQTKEFTSFTKTFINFITCGSGGKTDALMSVMNTVQVSYTRAKQRGLIKGLNTYNILQNPKYREAFNIKEEWANKHKHVTSIRKLRADQRTMSSGVRDSEGDNAKL
jgi:hypothetical protein